MGLDLSRPARRVLGCIPVSLSSNNSYKTNRLYRYGVTSALVYAVCFGISVACLGWAADGNAAQKVVSGVVATTDGSPLVGATVALVDLSGNELAVTTTDAAGGFEIETNASPGEYELIVANSRQLNEEQITLARTDLRIALKVSSATAAAPRSADTVSADLLSIPEKARHAIVMAQEQFKSGNLSGAMQEIDAALLLDPTSSEAWSMRALFKLSERDARAAVGDSEQAIHLDPQNASAFLVLGTAHNSLKEFDAAGQHLRHALELDPSLWQAQLELAKAWYGKKRFVLSLRELNTINKDFADVHLVRANVLMSLNRRTEGAQEFERFLQEAPDDPRDPQIRQILARAGTMSGQ
jgi:tetratricopeptide (TPR) repeat protein